MFLYFHLPVTVCDTLSLNCVNKIVIVGRQWDMIREGLGDFGGVYIRLGACLYAINSMQTVLTGCGVKI